MDEVANVFCPDCSDHHQAVIQVNEGGGAFVVTSWLEPHGTPVSRLVDEAAEMFADYASRGHLDQAAEIADKALWMRDEEEDGAS